MRTAVAFVVVSMLAACQPTVRRVETRFIPPTEPEQLACIERCNVTDRDCLNKSAPEPAPLPASADAVDQEQAEQIRREYDECSRQVESQHEQCEMRARASGERGTCYKPVCLVKGKLPAWEHAPGASSATKDAAVCARLYRSCYQRCGGRVETFQTCEGNC